MTYTPFDDGDTYQPKLPDLTERTPSYAPTPCYWDREWTPSVICPSPDPEELDDRSSPLHRAQSNQPGSLPFVEREDGRRWDGQPPNCIHYQIEWRVRLNNRVVAKGTELDLNQPPSFYWQRIKETAGSVLRGKITRDRRVRPDDITVVVSVNDRSQRDLTKRFENAGIDWTTVEKQLLTWTHLYHLGKELRLQISINYIEDSGPRQSRSDKRGNTSVTKRSLAEREIRIDAEHISGQYQVWRDVYRVMRCPGPPCGHEGQYCWQDSERKKHYKLRTHHMKTLVKYVEQGGVLESHDDVPDSLREQLYAEENHRVGKKKNSAPTVDSTCPPININFHPAGPSQQSIPSPSTNGAMPAKSGCAEPIMVHGLLDAAVKEYAKWQESRVGNETFRDNIKKACDVALENCLDLMQIYEDQDPGFFVKHDVKVGVARRFVRDIGHWVKQHREINGSEGNSNLV